MEESYSPRIAFGLFSSPGRGHSQEIGLAHVNAIMELWALFLIPLGGAARD